MALSGLGLVGFVITHLIGNLALYADDDGTAFNEYAHKLESIPGFVWIELGLAAVFVVHIALGIRLFAENREARPQGYRTRATKGSPGLASRSMIISGSVLLVFLVIHVKDFRVAKLLADPESFDLALTVKERLSTPGGALIYLVGVAALGLHMSHAFQSAFQTLGLNHPKYTPLIKATGLGLAVLLFLGFASFPLYCLFTA